MCLFAFGGLRSGNLDVASIGFLVAGYIVHFRLVHFRLCAVLDAVNFIVIGNAGRASASEKPPTKAAQRKEGAIRSNARRRGEIGKAMAGVMRMVTDMERNRNPSELSPKALGTHRGARRDAHHGARSGAHRGAYRGARPGAHNPRACLFP